MSDRYRCREFGKKNGHLRPYEWALLFMALGAVVAALIYGPDEGQIKSVADRPYVLLETINRGSYLGREAMVSETQRAADVAWLGGLLDARDASELGEKVSPTYSDQVVVVSVLNEISTRYGVPPLP